MTPAVARQTYLHWLQWRLGHALVDDLMTPDQAVAWHELCRELRLGEDLLDEACDETKLAAAGHGLDAWLTEVGASGGLWLVGPARTGVCTLLHDLVLGLCGRVGVTGPLPVPLLICGNATRASICMLGLTGSWHGVGLTAVLARWWAAVEVDIRRHVDRRWRVADLLAESPALLVILAGLDELRELSAQDTVLGWARELLTAADTAGIQVVVSSRDADVPELTELRAQGLRRVFVLPLTRAPITKFLTSWARLDGAWGRVNRERFEAAMAEDPGIVQLTRRPADLAVLAVLSAGTADLPDNLADLHRAMLATLDLAQPAHRQLLARVVADPDSALDMATRRAWLAALVAVAVQDDHVDLGEALGRDVRLGPAGSALLLAATRVWAEGGCPLRPVLAVSPVELGTRRCLHGHDDEMARLIWLGHHAGWWGPEAMFVLRRAMPPRPRLVEQRPSSIHPKPLLLALGALDEVWGPSAAPLVRALPLGLLLAEGGTLGPVTATALYSETPSPELRAVREVFRGYLQLELAFVSLAADDTTLQAIVMEMAAARDINLDGALDLVLAQEGVGPLRPRGITERDEPNERAAYLDLALTLGARLTPCGAPALVTDLERARQVALIYNENSTPLVRAQLEQLAGFLIVFLVYAVNRRMLPAELSCLHRSEVMTLQHGFAEPGRVASKFASERQAEVADDWRWVMHQLWAPHRIAGHLLARMPETLELTPEAVLPRCHAWLRSWLAMADVTP